MQNLIVLDVETGGRDCNNNPITQFAAEVVNPVNFRTLSKYTSFVKPYNNLKIEQDALKYTQVTLKQINEQGIDLSLLLKNIVDLVRSANKSGRASNRPIIVGHNVTFDIGFLKYAFALKNKIFFEYFDESFFDTLKIMRLREMHKPEYEQYRYTLGACCERAGVEHKDAHGAPADVEVTKYLFQYLVKNLRNAGNSNSEDSDTSIKTDKLLGRQKAVKQRENFVFEF